MIASPALRTAGVHSTNAHWPIRWSARVTPRAAVLFIASSLRSRSPSYTAWRNCDPLVANSSFSRYSLSLASRSKSSAWSEFSLTTSALVLAYFLFFRVRGVGVGNGGGFAFAFLELEHRVALQLLLDAFLQRRQRQLEDFHALDHPRRQELPQLRPHRNGLS